MTSSARLRRSLTSRERELVAGSAALVARHPVDLETIKRNQAAYQRRIAADALAKSMVEKQASISRQKAEAAAFAPHPAREKTVAVPKKKAAASTKKRPKTLPKLPTLKAKRVLEQQARRVEAKRLKAKELSRVRTERARETREENEAAWARMEAHRDAKRKPAVDCAPASSAAVRTKPSLCARCAGMSHRVRGPECIDCGTRCSATGGA